MNTFKWLIILLLALPLFVEAQLTYTYQNNLIVIEEGDSLSQAFTGGFIAPQYSTIDLNLDGVDDLFVFDRSSSKISTFLFENNQYQYAPQYEALFPPELKNWVLLRDYNCDGKMDLFTSSLFGMSLFENISSTKLEWELVYQTIYTEGSSGQINLQVSSLDLPAIGDVDNDGDLDILIFNFATGGGVEFHKNMSIENTGNCSLELVRTTKRYGDFEECSCDIYVFGVEQCPTSGRELHSGGKSIVSFNNSSNLVQDLLIGQEYCDLPGFLPNTGTINQAQMESVSFDFLSARIEYPSFCALDLYNDSTVDLLASPNSYKADGTQNYEGLSYLYQIDVQGDYKLVSTEFLKADMIDVGHKSSPVFTDLDLDGDEDLLIGTGITGAGASIWMYENTGTRTIPSFELKTKDYLDLKQTGLDALKLQIFDIDGNNLPDLILYKRLGNEQRAEVYLNTGNPINPYSSSSVIVLPLPNLSVWDNPYYFKLGSATGLLIGKQAGNLEYYTTSGNLAFPAWQLVSSTYLDLAEDFTRRNLNVAVADLNANGTEDLLTLDDSGELISYENFLSENNTQTITGIDPTTSNGFNLSFGKLARPVISNLFGTVEPTIGIGLLTGGIHLLKNTQSTDGRNELVLNVIIYPNPVENNQVVLQSNKNAKARVLDMSGKEVVGTFKLLAGTQSTLQLLLDEGIYILEVISDKNERKSNRIIIID